MRFAWLFLVFIIVGLSLAGCTCTTNSRSEIAPVNELVVFEYDYFGGGKTGLRGRITKESYDISKYSSYPTGYGRKGATKERSWEMVKWLFKYGVEPKGEIRGFFNASFTMQNGEIIKKSFDVDSDHLTLFQIIDDCDGTN